MIDPRSILNDPDPEMSNFFKPGSRVLTKLSQEIEGE